jgi:hypothetical protein
MGSDKSSEVFGEAKNVPVTGFFQGLGATNEFEKTSERRLAGMREGLVPMWQKRAHPVSHF